MGGLNPPVNFSTLSVQLSSKVLGGQYKPPVGLNPTVYLYCVNVCVTIMYDTCRHSYVMKVICFVTRNAYLLQIRLM